MARTGVGPRRLVHGQAVVDVMPIVQRDVGRMDVERLHCVDQLEDTLDSRPFARYGSIPFRFHLRINNRQEIGCGLQSIRTDCILNEASVPDRVKISGTLPACFDGVTAFVIEERDVQRLMYIAGPMPQRFQGDQPARVSTLFCLENLEVVPDRGKARMSRPAGKRPK